MPYRLAVFDMAGTTVYDGDAVNRCLRAALRAVGGLEISRDAANGVMGLHKPLAISRLLQAATDESDPNLAGAVLQDFEERMENHYRRSTLVREVDGATEVFAQLRSRGIAIALNTGFGRNLAEVILQRLDWKVPSMVNATIASDEVEAGRPAPHMIQRLMQQTGVADPSQVVKIGDTPADLMEGANARCGMIVGVTSGSHTADELRRYPHHALIRSLCELPGLLNQHASSAE